MDDLFDLLNEFTQPTKNTLTLKHECKHTNTIYENTVHVCMDCGLESVFNDDDDDDQQNFQIAISNENVVQRRKVVERNIFADIQNMNISKKHKDLANDLYKKIAEGTIFRGQTRKSIILAVVLITLQNQKIPISFDDLVKSFQIERKVALKGLRKVRSFDSAISSHETVEKCIDQICTSLNADSDTIDDIHDFYDIVVHNKDSFINRSRSVSVAAGVVFYFMQKKKNSMSNRQFSKHVGVSTSTINGVVKIISKLDVGN